MSEARRRKAAPAQGGRLPDALCIRHPEAEQDQGLPFVGLLFLLTPTADPEGLARRIAPQLAGRDEMPKDGAVVPLWTDEAAAWRCDVAVRMEARARLDGAPVVVVARVDHADADAAGFVYHQLHGELPAYLRTMLAEAMGKGVH